MKNSTISGISKLQNKIEMENYYFLRNERPELFYEKLLHEMFNHEEKEKIYFVNWSNNTYVEENFLETDSLLSLAFLIDKETYDFIVDVRKNLYLWIKKFKK